MGPVPRVTGLGLGPPRTALRPAALGPAVCTSQRVSGCNGVGTDPSRSLSAPEPQNLSSGDPSGPHPTTAGTASPPLLGGCTGQGLRNIAGRALIEFPRTRSSSRPSGVFQLLVKTLPLLSVTAVGVERPGSVCRGGDARPGASAVLLPHTHLSPLSRPLCPLPTTLCRGPRALSSDPCRSLLRGHLRNEALSATHTHTHPYPARLAKSAHSAMHLCSSSIARLPL